MRGTEAGYSTAEKEREREPRNGNESTGVIGRSDVIAIPARNSGCGLRSMKTQNVKACSRDQRLLHQTNSMGCWPARCCGKLPTRVRDMVATTPCSTAHRVLWAAALNQVRSQEQHHGGRLGLRALWSNVLRPAAQLKLACAARGHAASQKNPTQPSGSFLCADDTGPLCACLGRVKARQIESVQS